MDDDGLFLDIIESVRSWVDKIQQYSMHIKINILIDKKFVYRVILEGNGGMAQILVEKNEFAPYRYVSFEGAIMENDDQKFYIWNDSDGDSSVDILKQLDKGLELVLKFKH